MTATITAVRPVMAYVPGGAVLSRRARERRSRTYRTWRARGEWLAAGELPWHAECLLCGSWDGGHGTREAAARWGSESHPSWCHVVQGCHCPAPHITAAMGARLGLGSEYPRHLAGVLFRLAGGRRVYCPPSLDLHKTPHGAPEGTYYYWR